MIFHPSNGCVTETVSSDLLHVDAVQQFAARFASFFFPEQVPRLFGRCAGNNSLSNESNFGNSFNSCSGIYLGVAQNVTLKAGFNRSYVVKKNVIPQK